MFVETLHHVTIGVTDLSRAREFYARVLGLREIERPPFDFGGAWFELGDRQLHLIVRPSRGTGRAGAAIESRAGHFALRVRSYSAALEHLRAAGVAYEARPHNLTPWPQIYLSDPDGNVIELNAAALDEARADAVGGVRS